MDLRSLEVPKVIFEAYKCVVKPVDISEKEWNKLNKLADRIINDECGNYYVRFKNMELAEGLYLLTKLAYATRRKVFPAHELQVRYEVVDEIYEEFSRLRELAIWDVGNEITRYGRYVIPLYYNYCAFNNIKVLMSGDRPLEDIYSIYKISGLTGLKEEVIGK